HCKECKLNISLGIETFLMYKYSTIIFINKVNNLLNEYSHFNCYDRLVKNIILLTNTIEIKMSEWHPQIVKIEKVEKHPNADNLDIVTVLNDYPVVTKHNEYNVGDLSVYIPIDSIVPDNELFYFLCPKVYEKYEDENGQIQQRQIGLKYPVGSVPEKYRIIKAKKLRGIYSQGILVKITDVIKDENTISSLKVG